jgi:predicted RNA-binding protein with PUA-like domain
MKSEPDVYSFETLLKDGVGIWDGVRNYQARNNLMAMKKGDRALFYHSNIGKEVVGVMEITKEHYPDPTTEDKRWVVVEVKPIEKLKKPVKLDTIKKDLILQNIPLIKHTRLSVMPLQAFEFERILMLSKD